MQFLRAVFFSFLFILITESCTVVKPYQRVYLNDQEMQMGNDVGGRYEERVQDIRESAYPAGSTTQAGSCGCN